MDDTEFDAFRAKQVADEQDSARRREAREQAESNRRVQKNVTNNWKADRLAQRLKDELTGRTFRGLEDPLSLDVEYDLPPRVVIRSSNRTPILDIHCGSHAYHFVNGNGYTHEEAVVQFVLTAVAVWSTSDLEKAARGLQTVYCR